jgi:hypothetical protein
VLIILAALGIVFRDKLRTEWIKIKDKLGGKKEKKKFEMPMTMNPNSQGRILPRRILPPGQGQPMHSSQQPSRFPIRGAAVSSSASAATPGISRGPQTSQPAQPAKPVTPSTTTTQQPPKKPEEKPKSSELDDVLKKLKDMGNK